MQIRNAKVWKLTVVATHAIVLALSVQSVMAHKPQQMRNKKKVITNADVLIQRNDIIKYRPPVVHMARIPWQMLNKWGFAFANREKHCEGNID